MAAGNDDLDFPTTRSGLRRFIDGLRMESARPDHGRVGALIGLAEELRRHEIPRAEAMPWEQFSDDDLLACIGDFAMFRVALEHNFGEPGDAVIAECLNITDPPTRSHIKADLFIVTVVPATEGMRALKLDIRGRRSGRELERRLGTHVGSHLALEQVVRRLADAPAEAQALAGQIVRGFSAEAARGMAESLADTVSRLAWSKVPADVRAQLLAEYRPHLGQRGTVRHLADISRWEAGERDSPSPLPSEDLVRHALAGKLNHFPKTFGHLIRDGGRKFGEGADAFDVLGSRKKKTAPEPTTPGAAGLPDADDRQRLIVEFKGDERLPQHLWRWGLPPLAPSPEHCIELHDLRSFLQQHPEHQRGYHCARLLGEGDTVVATAERFGVTRPTVYAWVRAFQTAYREWQGSV